MTASEAKKQFNFSSVARYRVCVKGFLDDSWSERFSDMRISNQTEGIISPLALIEGSMRDQTELIGVLSNLYEMHLPLVSVDTFRLMIVTQLAKGSFSPLLFCY